MVCEAGGCVCDVGLDACGEECVSLKTDGDNCGACGVTCVDQVCSEGVCTTSCATGVPCGNTCANLGSDPLNCGACGNACATGQRCSAGLCSCSNGEQLCGDQCVDVATNPAHCGACNTVCEAPGECVDGICEVPVTATGGEPATGGTPAAGGTPSDGGTPATGGRRPTGGAPGVGGATGGTNDGSYTVGDGAYVTTCSWKGFAWTSAGPDATSSIQPANFNRVRAGGDLCVSGTVGADPDYAGYAMILFNLNQANPQGDVEQPNAEIVPQGNGLYVDVTNSANNDLRIQIQDSLGADSADHRWCALYSRAGVIAWNTFNTACWDNSGSAYAREPINAVAVAVPGDSGSDTPFDYCVNEIYPAGDPDCP